MTAPQSSSPDSVQDAMQECVDIAMQYDDCGGEFIAQKIRDRILSLQPATPSPIAQSSECSCDWATGECQGPVGCKAVAQAIAQSSEGESAVAATPSNPTACPTSDPSWPESQPCSICGAFGPWFDTPQNGECVEATGGDAMADEVQAATPPRYIVDGLPELPDDDADFTPYLARKIIAKYQELLRGVAQPPSTADAEREWTRLNDVFHKALQQYPYSQHALHYLWNNTIARPGGTVSSTPLCTPSPQDRTR
jgi:hypothetical protein